MLRAIFDRNPLVLIFSRSLGKDKQRSFIILSHIRCILSNCVIKNKRRADGLCYTKCVASTLILIYFNTAYINSTYLSAEVINRRLRINYNPPLLNSPLDCTIRLGPKCQYQINSYTSLTTYIFCSRVRIYINLLVTYSYNALLNIYRNIQGTCGFSIVIRIPVYSVNKPSIYLESKLARRFHCTYTSTRHTK